MNENNCYIDGVVFRWPDKIKLRIYAFLNCIRIFLMRLAKGLLAAWQAWDRKWREQALRAAEIERAQALGKARFNDYPSKTQWYGHF